MYGIGTGHKKPGHVDIVAGAIASSCRTHYPHMQGKESEVLDLSQRMVKRDVFLASRIYADYDAQKKSCLPAYGPGIESVIRCRAM